MRRAIEIFLRNDSPAPIFTLPTKINGESFAKDLQETDMDIIKDNWEEVIKLNSRVFSLPNGLVTLYDTTNGLEYRYTDFMQYVTICRTSKSRNLSKSSYENMRVGAIGCALDLADGTVFVHKRSEKATHAASLWDSSFAGLLQVKNESVSLEEAIYEKLDNELNLKPHEITLRGVTGVHSSASPDFSGTITLAATTKLGTQEFKKRIVPGAYSDYEFVPINQLPSFIVDHYVERGDLLGDGTATLLGMLDKLEFHNTVSKINRNFPAIVLGELRKGVFYEKST